MREVGYEAAALARYKHLVKHFREQVSAVGSEYEVDIRIALVYLVGAVFLLRHTAAYGKHSVAARFLQLLKAPRARKRLFFRMLAYCAGVYYYQIGVLCFFRTRISAFERNSEKPFGIRLVLLAAVGDNEHLWVAVFFFYYAPDLFGKAVLPCRLRGRNENLFCHFAVPM